MKDETILENLKTIAGWIYNKEKSCLEKDFHFKSYLKNIAFVNAIAWIANKDNHHPDLEVSFNRCTVRITTHDEDGISEKDFSLAHKINQL